MIEEIVSMVHEFCENRNYRLLYLVKFGSHLYGTNTPDSDLDLFGIFVPSVRDIILSRDKKSLHINSSNNEKRNTNNDYDVTLHSLKYWLNSKLETAEIVGLDLLFSHTHEECILYKDPCMDILFKNINKLITLDGSKHLSTVQYAERQARKYGLKGTMVGVLQKLAEYIHQLPPNTDLVLADVVSDIIRYAGGESRQLYVETKFERDYLVVNGKMHSLKDTSVREFGLRMVSAYNKYGERARLAQMNEGIDWKACSHAVRAAIQTKELLQTGYITFPINSADTDLIMKIKRGELDWDTVKKILEKELEELKELEKNPKPIDYNRDLKFIDDFIVPN